MRKILIATAATLSVFAAIGLPTATAAGKTRHFTLTGVGASVGGNESVGVLQGPGGYRAVEVENITSLNAMGGTSRMTLFDAREIVTGERRVLVVALRADRSGGFRRVSGAASTGPRVLSRREVDVLRLVALGGAVGQANRRPTKSLLLLLSLITQLRYGQSSPLVVLC